MNSSDEYSLKYRMSKFGLKVKKEERDQSNKFLKIDIRLPRVQSNLRPSRIMQSTLENSSASKSFISRKLITDSQIQTPLDIDKSKHKLKRRKDSFFKSIKQLNPQQEKFGKILGELIDLLCKLKEIFNNQRKLFVVIKNLVLNKKNLTKILLKSNSQDVVEISEIRKLCLIKEIAIIQGENKLIEKYDLSLQDDINYAKDALENIIEQTQLQKIRRLGEQEKKSRYKDLNSNYKLDKNILILNNFLFKYHQ